ncbi:MAG: hypothetical protein R3331_03995 [Sulfurospirillaceae bacterium]|nr:hypothetical protein [Sulfurospirillaceae bacterium]
MLSFFSILYPIVLFFTLKYLGLTLQDAIVLKFLPLLVSIYFTALIALSHFKKKSLILKFAKKFSKKDFNDEEVQYIEQSTLFWIGICGVNILLHVIVILQKNEYFWVIYTSFGWYFVFLIGALLQYVHKKYIFLKRVEDV